VRLLLDENLSPRLVSRLAAKGVAAQHIAHVGRAGMSDAALWAYAFATNQVVATLNARDFLLLARSVEFHPGLIVLRTSSLPPDGQWRHLESAIDLALAELAAGRDLVNRVIDVLDVGTCRTFDLSGP
jgi:predicted nuclease of predicted toxin-antitoxin system